MPVPSRCVVDTNVVVVANGRNSEASPACVAASATALRAVMGQHGHLFVDAGRLIVGEYTHNAFGKGQRGAGDAFVTWVLQSEWTPSRVSRVPLTTKGSLGEFVETPTAPPGMTFDPADTKFLAVAAAAPEKPPILQALDSKWWGWRGALAKAGVSVRFLCEKEIAAKHAEKMGR